MRKKAIGQPTQDNKSKFQTSHTARLLANALGLSKRNTLHKEVEKKPIPEKPKETPQKPNLDHLPYDLVIIESKRFPEKGNQVDWENAGCWIGWDTRGTVVGIVIGFTIRRPDENGLVEGTDKNEVFFVDEVRGIAHRALKVWKGPAEEYVQSDYDYYFRVPLVKEGDVFFRLEGIEIGALENDKESTECTVHSCGETQRITFDKEVEYKEIETKDRRYVCLWKINNDFFAIIRRANVYSDTARFDRYKYDVHYAHLGAAEEDPEFSACKRIAPGVVISYLNQEQGIVRYQIDFYKNDRWAIHSKPVTIHTVEIKKGGRTVAVNDPISGKTVYLTWYSEDRYRSTGIKAETVTYKVPGWLRLYGKCTTMAFEDAIFTVFLIGLLVVGAVYGGSHMYKEIAKYLNDKDSSVLIEKQEKDNF